MALTEVTTTFNLHDYFGDSFDARRTKGWATNNADNQTIHDNDTGETRIGSGYATINADGTGSFTHWAPGPDGNPTSWQTTYHFDVPDRTARGGRRTESFGPYTVTSSGMMTALVEEQAVPATYLTTVTAELQTYVDAGAAASTSAAASATSAAASADLASAVAGADTADDLITILDANPASDFRTQQDARQSAAIQTSIIEARHSNTLAMMGDSFLANTLIYEAGPLAWQHKPSAMLTGGRILLGQRLELVKDAGISGNTTTQMLARYDTDITPHGAGWVFIGGGTNDVDGGASAATIIANLTAMFDKADRDHARIIAATIPPRDANTAPKNAVLFEVNEWIRREAFVRPGMVLVDLYAVLSEATAATFKSGISLDGIHPYTTAGGWRMARAFYDALKDVVPPVPVLPSSNVDSRSLITCGMFTGTAGGKGTGVTGTTASGWFVEPAPSLTCTATVAKVARTDLGPGDMQEIEVTAGTAQARARNTAVGTAWNPGDEVYATIGFEADTLPTTPAASVFDLNVTCYNAGFSRLLRGVDNGLMAYEFEALNIPASGVLRTPSIVIPALTTTLQITVTMSAGAKVRLYQAELVKGSWL